MLQPGAWLGQWRDMDRPLILRGAMVAGTLLASAGVAIRPSVGLLAVVAALPFVVAIVRWRNLGLVALVLGSFLVPFEISTGTGTRVNAAVVITGFLVAVWLVGMLLRRDLRLLTSPPITPILLFGLVCVLAFLVGIQPWLQQAATAPLVTQLGGLAIYLLSLAAFLLAAHQIRDMAWLRRLTWLYLAWAGVYMLRRIGVLNGLPIPSAPGSDWSVFWVWTVALAFSQALVNRTLPRGWRLALAGLTVATLYAGLSNRSWNSGWVPSLVAAYVIVCLAIPRLAVPATLLGLIVAIPRAQGIMSLWLDPKNQYDLLSRTAAWRILWDIIQLDPILGTGFANYYWYTPLYPLLGWSSRFNSHNNYVDVAAQTGFVGVVCLAWFTWRITCLAWRLRTLAPAGFGRAYACGALAGIAGMLVSAALGDWVLPFVYNIGLAGLRSSLHGWFFLGGVVALEHIALQHEQKNASAQVSSE